MENLEKDLFETLPRFASEGQKLAEAFARGDWRVSLERLTKYLQELQEVLEGFRLVREAEGKLLLPELNRIPELFAEMSALIRSQSWVEVSDLLLYELVPLIESWKNEGQEE